MPTRLFWPAAVPALALLLALPARGDKAPAKPVAKADAPWHVDDDELFHRLTDRLADHALNGKCLTADKLKAKVAKDRTCKVALAKPAAKRLDPEEVYALALPSVFVVGSVVPDGDDYVDGRMATGWVLAADGVLVTNWHVFDQLEDGEVFGAMDHKGTVYPLTDVLAVDKSADIAVVRVAATGLAPLAVADRPAAVGAWVGVLGHPGDRYFTFTQGAVSRYSQTKPDGKPTERWMSVTADYAYGSSGSPVLNRSGAVVGMAALTENLDYPEGDQPPPDDKAKKPGEGKLEPPAVTPKADEKKPDPPAAAGSLLQMVVKLTTPASNIRKVIGAE